MEVLMMSNVPLGGSLSADWQLPASLTNLLLAACNLTGPLPDGWLLPASIRAVILENNTLTGTIPQSFTALPNLQMMDLSENRLSGKVPANFSFGAYDLQALDVWGNNLTGVLGGCWQQGARAACVAWLVGWQASSSGRPPRLPALPLHNSLGHPLQPSPPMQAPCPPGPTCRVPKWW